MSRTSFEQSVGTADPAIAPSGTERRQRTAHPAPHPAGPPELRVTVKDLLDRHATERPDHPFIECIDTARSISFREARTACDRIAAWCDRAGVRANDRVALIGGNSLEYLLIYLAVLRHGATLCALNPESLGGNLPAILDALRPVAILRERGIDPVPSAIGAPAWLPYGRWSDSAADPDEFFGQANRLPAEPSRPPVGGPDDIATITYTSGTTGRPKGVVHHYAAVFANAIGTARALEMTPADRILEYRSFAWLSARARLMTAIYSGSTLVIARKFSQSRFFDWVREQRLTIAFAVPAVISMLINRPVDVHRRDMPQLRFVTSSTAPLATEHQRAFEARYGVEVLQFYGISESGGLTANPPGRRKVGSVGRPSLYQDLRIVDADGNPLVAGQVGEIETGGEQVCTGYLEYDGRISTLRGRRLRTGDLGYLDDDGYLFITGRRSETINRGGAKVSPIEIDNVLLSHPAVAEAATIGVPDRIYGEEIAGFVVARPGETLDAAALAAHCVATLPEYKRPRTLDVIGAIPRNARAKIDRQALMVAWRDLHPET